jgi:hypothetical protein
MDENQAFKPQDRLLILAEEVYVGKECRSGHPKLEASSINYWPLNPKV